MRAARSDNRGFSLLELMVVVAVIGLLAVITINGLDGVTRRAEANNVLGQFALDVANARYVAAQKSVPVVLVLFYDDGTAPANVANRGYRIFAERAARVKIDTTDIAGLNLESPASSTSSAFSSGSGSGLDKVGIPRQFGLVQVPAAFPTTASFASPPFPFASLYSLAKNNTTSALGCTFCRSISGIRYGAIRFETDGRVTFGKVGSSVDPNAQGGGLLFANTRVANDNRTGAVAVLAPSGMTRIFSR